MLTLYGSAPAYGVCDLSPFVVKVATFCRMAGVPYETAVTDPRKAPKGKIPYVRYGEAVIADSTAIVRHLSRTHRDLDEGMLPADRAVATAFKAMLEEHYYFCLMHARWIDPRSWAQHRATFARFLSERAGVPGFVAPLVVDMIRRSTRTKLHEQGTGRHDLAEIERMACEHLDAVESLLGDKPYLFGDAPRSLDATAWAMLAATRGFDSPGAARDRIVASKTLTAYLDRIEAKYWAKP